MAFTGNIRMLPHICLEPAFAYAVHGDTRDSSFSDIKSDSTSDNAMQNVTMGPETVQYRVSLRLEISDSRSIVRGNSTVDETISAFSTVDSGQQGGINAENVPR